MTTIRLTMPALAIALAASGLAGCQQTSDAPQQADTTSQAAPEGAPGVSVSDGRLVLPAVSGNPAAVYFDIAYEGEKPVDLAGVDVEGAASAELHETSMVDGAMQMRHMEKLTLENGAKLQFKPGGMHVMAMQPSPELKAGGTTEVTLILSSGDKYSFPAAILAAGDKR